MEFEGELEMGIGNGYQFPFHDEEEFPLEEFPRSAKNNSLHSVTVEDSDEDDRLTNVFQQIIETNKSRRYSAMEYEAELKKRGAPFKYGLVDRYLRKFPFEDEENLPNSEYYLSDNDEVRRRPNAHEIVKRFLKQVRESNGYEVDCIPPLIGSAFVPKEPYPKDEGSRNLVIHMVHFAIEIINAETGETYELVQIEKNVGTYCMWYHLLTFTVRKVGTNDDASLRTIRAMLTAPPSMDCRLDEWMFKPPATDMVPEKTRVKIGESTTLLE